MLEIIRYEWKKIVNSTLVKLIFTGTGLFFLLNFVSGIGQTRATDYNGKQYSGISAIRVLKETQPVFELSQENVDKIVGQYLEYLNSPETSSNNTEYYNLSEEMYYSFMEPNQFLFSMIYNGYDDPSAEKTLSDALKDNYRKDFRKAQIENYEKFTGHLVELGIITEQQAQYWNKKSGKINGSTFGYCGGWREILYMSDWFLLIMIIVCICVAPVFSGEYQSKCDSLFLCMKYGRSKLVTAKIVATVSFTTAAYWAFVIVYSALCLFVYGGEGADLPVQLQNPTTTIGYDMTMAQATLILMLFGYILTLGMTGITLLFSALLKNPFHVIIIAFLLIVVPVFAQALRLGYTFRHILYLLPSSVTFFDYSSFHAYSIGKNVLSWPSASMIVNMAGAVVFSLLAMLIFKRHEVNK